MIATAFAFIVVLLGAFTRLSNAGLGCPDWPGCYGFSHIPTENHDIAKANQAFPEQPYEFSKAWPEMVHRYFAGTLGLMVLALALLSLKVENKPARFHSFALLILVTFQAALGMWTVTMKLHPGIVMSHLIGGFTTFVLLASLSLRYSTNFSSVINAKYQLKFKTIVIFSTVVVALQIILGAWTSANYAATICYELPICQGDWFNDSNFVKGFTLWGHNAENYEYGILDAGGRIAIHASHRLGALLVILTLSLLSFRLLRQQGCSLLKKNGFVIAGLLALQVLLGVLNITLQLPLFNAVAHNGVGALLLLVMVLLITQIFSSAKNSNKEELLNKVKSTQVEAIEKGANND